MSIMKIISMTFMLNGRMTAMVIMNMRMLRMSIVAHALFLLPMVCTNSKLQLTRLRPLL